MISIAFHCGPNRWAKNFRGELNHCRQRGPLAGAPAIWTPPPLCTLLVLWQIPSVVPLGVITLTPRSYGLGPGAPFVAGHAVPLIVATWMYATASKNAVQRHSAHVAPETGNGPFMVLVVRQALRVAVDHLIALQRPHMPL